MAKTRTPSEPAGFGGAIGFAGSSGLFWLAVQRTRPLWQKRARRQSPLASVGRLASPAQAGSYGSRFNELCEVTGWPSQGHPVGSRLS